jgi:hypothetical protein
LETTFGDASVTLPDGKGTDDPEWPDHWSKEKLDWDVFNKQWRKFQSDNGYDPDNPDLRLKTPSSPPPHIQA